MFFVCSLALIKLSHNCLTSGNNYFYFRLEVVLQVGIKAPSVLNYMPNKSSKNRRVATITFQPSDDVAEVLEEVLKLNPERSYKSHVINEALRSSLRLAAEADEAGEKARRAVLNEGRKMMAIPFPANPDNIVPSREIFTSSQDSGLREIIKPKETGSAKHKTALKPQKPASQKHS